MPKFHCRRSRVAHATRIAAGRLVLPVIALVMPVACRQPTRIHQDQEFDQFVVTEGLDKQDWGMLVQQVVGNLREDEWDTRLRIEVGEVVNRTNQHLDTDALTQSLTTALQASGVFEEVRDLETGEDSAMPVDYIFNSQIDERRSSNSNMTSVSYSLTVEFFDPKLSVVERIHGASVQKTVSRSR
jgi:PBP1b-binding outer membrane lipoprotein LpoB